MQNEQQIFKLHAPYQPTGDQPQAIEELVRGFKEGNQFETLLGVTGSGKTFTMANVIAQLNKPTLIISHNKTLAAQLYGEFKEFFPENAVEYFVSYYDYYQPEAYVPQTDTYIAKDSAINEEIDKLRLSATAALVERKDVIVIASVSCIYGLGSPEDYLGMMVSLRPAMGKTAFVLNIAQYAAFKDNHAVAMFSLEMSKEQLVTRLMASESMVDSQQMRTGDLRDSDWEKLLEGAALIGNSKLIIDDTATTLAEIRSKCRKYKQTYGIELVVID